MGERYGSDAIVDQLVDLGVDLIPFAPGATFRGIHDSLVNHREDAPEIVECLHEEIAVAVAHGYAKASGRPAAALIHDIVGLQHATMAIYNAWCDRVPLLLLGGTGPVDAAKRRPWIDWIHTANVQATQVRDYTKWDDQPASLEATFESLVRGCRLAESAPRGPVYVTIDSEIQESRWDGEPAIYPADAVAPAAPLHPDPEAVARIADRLLGAERPLIAVESIGRSQAAMDDLVALAEELGAAVVEVERDYNRTELCLPTDHPLNTSGMERPWEPDVVLGIEVRDLDVVRAPRGAAVLQVTTAGLGPKAWAADLQRVQRAEVVVPAEAPAALAAILAAVRARRAARPDAEERIARRRSEIAAHTGAARARWRAAVEEGSGITVPRLADRIDAATRDRPRVLANGSLHNWVHRLWRLDRADQYLGSSGGAGLGYGLGASVGAALAHRGTGRLVIDIQSDGDALMSPQALWTAAHHRAPLLIVMENNRMWGNSFMHAHRIADLRGRSHDRAHIGTVVDDPPVDFAALAGSMGFGHTATVTDAADLDAALAAARDHVLSGAGPALVDVIVPEGG